MRTYRGMKRTLPGQRKRHPFTLAEGTAGRFAYDEYGQLYTPKEYGVSGRADEPSMWRKARPSDVSYFAEMRKGRVAERLRRIREGEPAVARTSPEIAHKVMLSVDRYYLEEGKKKAIARHERRRARKRKTSHARTK